MWMSLLWIDNDRAVKLLLAQKAEEPNWWGTDVLAMNHVVARHVITHPDIQAFYVEEGKWVKYLADRVPEYEQYKP